MLTMKTLIVGYGRMGKEVEEVLISRKHSITAIVDKKADIEGASEVSEKLVKESDVVIEFSLADAVLQNTAVYAVSGVPAVIGTTGWEKDFDAVRKKVEDNNSGLIYGSNFSIGAHLFLKIIEKSVRLQNSIPGYDILMYELHHKMKKDSPSGTALTIGNKIIENSRIKNKIVTEKLDRSIDEDELHIASVRGGDIPGVHTVIMDSYADSIEISHSARNRRGFAVGAVMAAEWIQNKKGFYGIETFIDDIFSEKENEK